MSKRKKKTKKTVTKAIRKTWEGGDNPIGMNTTSPICYETYVKQALEIMSDKFQVRTYKLAPAEDYPQFMRGKDLRVQIWFDKKYLGYEFLVEIPFWLQSNRNKEDRLYMRQTANAHLRYIHEEVEKAKAKAPTTKKKTGITTQNAFDKNLAKHTDKRRKKVVSKK
jgi:hypothetical protein